MKKSIAPTSNTNHPKTLRYSPEDIFCVSAFKTLHAQLFRSQSELDYLIRNRALNGLEACGAIITRGRRLTIVAPRFIQWLLN